MTLDPVFVAAVHETGHVVSFFSTAADMGFSPAEIVGYVDLEYETDGDLITAATEGEFWSSEIKAVMDTARPAELSPEATVAAARAAGADIGRWARAEIRKYVAGSVAEAKYLSVSVIPILWGEGCADDAEKIVFVARIAEMTDEELTDAITGAVDFLEELWSQEHEWNALLELAHEIHDKGRLDGATCWAIYENSRKKRGQPDEVSN
jgi:hypothetical protein